jgi:16S rRNA (guanine527-N7)-methyltransferase
MRAWNAELRAGLAELSLVLDEVQIKQLLDYHELIQKWNKVYNLTAVRSPAEMLTHHLLDSLAVVSPLRVALRGLVSMPVAPVEAGAKGGVSSTRLLDVGSGAGLPGVVIAICCPEVLVDCVDAVAKKAAFVRQAALSLGLTNLRGLHARVESLTDRYEVISSRAFASLGDFTGWSQAALQEGGVWLAMKGKYPADEIATLPPSVTVFHVEQLAVPGLGAERCIVWIKKVPVLPD